MNTCTGAREELGNNDVVGIDIVVRESSLSKRSYVPVASVSWVTSPAVCRSVADSCWRSGVPGLKTTRYGALFVVLCTWRFIPSSPSGSGSHQALQALSS